MVLWYVDSPYLITKHIANHLQGALHQYHTCLLLLIEVYSTPERYYIDRIWKCLDHVFELPSDVDRRTKARSILTEVINKTELYHNLRRVRVPKSVLDNILPENSPPSYTGQHSGSPDVSPPPVAKTSPPPITASLGSVLPSPRTPEYRKFPTVGTDAIYPTQQSVASSASPQSSDTGSLLGTIETPLIFSGGSGDMMVDVDWVCNTCPMSIPRLRT